MKAATTKYLEIVQAEHISGYKIRLAFNDGVVRVMDFRAVSAQGHESRHHQIPAASEFQKIPFALRRSDVGRF